MLDGCTDIEVVTIDTPGLGDRSYVASADGWAVAIDPQRDIDRTELVLAIHGLRLGAVLETHIHNDYVTGGLALARRHRVPYVVPAGPRLGFDARRVSDGDGIRVGPLTVDVIDSAGHTDAHATYAVRVEHASSGVAFTGGSLLLGSTGRTDLLGAELAEALARRQHRSVRRLAELLPGETPAVSDARLRLVLHGRPVPPAAGRRSRTRSARTPRSGWTRTRSSPSRWRSLGPYPRYFALMAPRNAGLPDAIDLEPVPEVTLGEVLDARVTDPETVVLDVRPRDQWARGHVAGSLAIDGAGGVASWFGWVDSIEADIVLVAETAERAEAARRDLVRIGADRVRAACVIPETAGRRDRRLRATRRATFADLAAAPSVPGRLVLDVRERQEWLAGHLDGAVHVPAHALAATDLGALATDDVWVHCAAGFRAAIAASLLERHGIAATVVDDDFAGAPSVGLRITRPVRPSRARGMTRAMTNPTPSQDTGVNEMRTSQATRRIDGRGARTGAAVSVVLLIGAILLAAGGATGLSILIVALVAAAMAVSAATALRVNALATPFRILRRRGLIGEPGPEDLLPAAGLRLAQTIGARGAGSCSRPRCGRLRGAGGPPGRPPGLAPGAARRHGDLRRLPLLRRDLVARATAPARAGRGRGRAADPHPALRSRRCDSTSPRPGRRRST